MCASSLKISRKWREINKSRNDTRLEHIADDLFPFFIPLGKLFGVLPEKSGDERFSTSVFILKSRHKCFQSIARLLARPVIVDCPRYLVNFFTLQPSKKITGTRCCRKQIPVKHSACLFSDLLSRSSLRQHAYRENVEKCRSEANYRFWECQEDVN